MKIQLETIKAHEKKIAELEDEVMGRLADEFLRDLGRELREQDNRMTSYPVWQVQSERGRGHLETVSVHLTNRAAEQFAGEMQYDLRNPCIYVSSQHDCPEFNRLIAWLKECR